MGIKQNKVSTAIQSYVWYGSYHGYPRVLIGYWGCLRVDGSQLYRVGIATLGYHQISSRDDSHGIDLAELP